MTVWLPTVKVDELKLAVVVPPLVVNVPWPMLLAPSEKVTVPVGVVARRSQLDLFGRRMQSKPGLSNPDCLMGPH